MDISVYYPDVNATGLVAVTKTVKAQEADKYQAAVEALLAGTDDKKLTAVFPKKAKLRKVSVSGGVAKVDDELHQKMLQSTVGKVEEVLFEQPVDDEHMEGLCGPYLRVVVPGTAELANTIVKVKITGIKEDFLLGELN